jgi:hypothetical protein
VQFFAQMGDKGATFAVYHDGRLAVLAVTDPVAGSAVVEVPLGARFVEVCDADRSVRFT